MTGNDYEINGTSVLSNNTLGSGITTSSLNTVATLNSGTISTGFGTIDNGSSNITSGGRWRLDVDGTGINAAGSFNFGAAVTDSAIYWNGTNLEIDTTTATEFSISGTTEADIAADGFNIITGDSYQINNTSVLNATTLGGAVVNSSLTGLGTVTSGTILAFSPPQTWPPNTMVEYLSLASRVAYEVFRFDIFLVNAISSFVSTAVPSNEFMPLCGFEA